MALSNPLYIYLGITLISILVIFITLLIASKRVQKNIIEHVEKLRSSNAIKTKPPIRQAISKFKNRAKGSVYQRFSVIRYMIFFSIFIVAAFSLSFPFLDKLPKAVISILVAAGAFLIGTAAKPFIDNIISGFVISTSKHVIVGDTITFENNYGTIEDISPTHTILKIWDWRRLVIPNSLIINSSFVNHSLYDKWQWTHVEFWISYKADIETVKEIAKEGAGRSKYFSQNAPPSFWVMETAKDSIQCWIAAWAKSASDAWMLRNDIRTHIISEFQKNNISTHLMNFNAEQGPGNKKPAEPMRQ